jgi:hypothetical protein
MINNNYKKLKCRRTEGIVGNKCKAHWADLFTRPAFVFWIPSCIYSITLTLLTSMINRILLLAATRNFHHINCLPILSRLLVYSVSVLLTYIMISLHNYSFNIFNIACVNNYIYIYIFMYVSVDI